MLKIIRFYTIIRIGGYTMYKYFKNNKQKTEIDYTATKSFLEKHGIIIDAKHFDLIEAAENGDQLAMCDLFVSFFGGDNAIPGIPRNYFLARYYIDMLLEKNERNNGKVKAGLLKNKGLLERKFENYDHAINNLSDAVTNMICYMQPQDWDFDLFYHIWDVYDLAKNAKKT